MFGTMEFMLDLQTHYRNITSGKRAKPSKNQIAANGWERMNTGLELLIIK